ncbi:pyruvate, water dikinase [Desulfacinum hydrothermale DSM 13146]|uniref:Phosphoenolpyruvate synthase n=1 Tax=Desulfacinum hydrothermale DSM 13146 TaxID=1121390 RepID=A0A1W1WXN8_9BACT|nr:PEP/pyruvate-binding domain-containing protein [Desulfacinum hydrothermale]SMC16506.1 pyruvate, water dikinase [Desulfacinum hydrothermale DSM 13146]
MKALGARIRQVLNRWTRRRSPLPLPQVLEYFRSILARNNEILELMAEMGDKLSGEYVFDSQYIRSSCEKLIDLCFHMIHDLNTLGHQKYMDLYDCLERNKATIKEILAGRPALQEIPYTILYEHCNRDWREEVGGKNANLTEVRNVLELPTPDGFAITIRAYHELLDAAGINDLIARLDETGPREGKDLEQALRDVQEKILNLHIPDAIASEIQHRIETVARRTGGGEEIFFAVRSSAPGEDTEHSFAGLHRSFLNVGEGKLVQAYRKVLASTFSPEAWRYRRDKGFRSHERAMAVGCQVMVDAVVSGVLYTLDPVEPRSEMITVAATWGFGPPVVEGSRRVDRFQVSRDPPHPLLQMHVVHKQEALVMKPGGGMQWVEVPEPEQTKACLNSSQLSLLASTGLLLERYFKRPQDVEWAFDTSGRLVILQARPLRVKPFTDTDTCRLADLAADTPVVWSGRGDVVQRGIAAGRVFVVEGDEDLQRVPPGAILVARESSPRLAQVIRQVQGIITDVGSPMGHMATVAREFRVPTVVNTRTATRDLRTGDEITLDANENVIYRGRIQDLCYYELAQGEVFEESYEYRLLQRLLRHITPLNLVDPQSPQFSPQGCRTLHDITRFVHERAVAELANINLAGPHLAGSKPKRLQASIPLDLRVIDAEGGTQADPHERTLQLQDIVSVPMRAFLSGLVGSNLWERTPVGMDFGAFMSSMSRTFDTHRASLQEVGLNLAVVSSNYMNVNLRIGYHFNIIDAYVTDRIDDNYIYFRFLGGVTDSTRRARRARFIAEMLARWGFRVEIHGDLVVGRMKKRARATMEEKLRLVGALVAYTRQLDVQLVSDQEVIRHLDRFTRLLESPSEGPEDSRPKGGSHG